MVMRRWWKWETIWMYEWAAIRHDLLSSVWVFCDYHEGVGTVDMFLHGAFDSANDADTGMALWHSSKNNEFESLIIYGYSYIIVTHRTTAWVHPLKSKHVFTSYTTNSLFSLLVRVSVDLHVISHVYQKQMASATEVRSSKWKCHVSCWLESNQSCLSFLEQEDLLDWGARFVVEYSLGSLLCCMWLWWSSLLAV